MSVQIKFHVVNVDVVSYFSGIYVVLSVFVPFFMTK